MSKGLEAFERIKYGVDNNLWDGDEYDDLDIIEKELKEGEKNKKILEIIKNNRDMKIAVLSSCTKWDEYDFLKEVLL